ncbi:restriction endonuclease subunit S, partial [Turicibacter sp. H121]
MNKQTFLWGSIPSEWTIQNLNELTTYISRGKQPKYVDYSEIRALNQKAIRWGFIDNSVLKYHNPEVKVDEKHFIKKGDVVINSTGTGTVGRTYYFGYSPEQIFADSHVTLVRTNSEVLNPQFLMYQLSTKAYQHFIEGSFLAGSTGQVEFNKSKVQQLPILLPTISEQNSIANILSSLDEKIELNNQMNETLEEIAEGLFKRWFVDFEFPNEEGQPYKSSGGEMVESELGMIPYNWKSGVLGDLIYVQNGYAFKGKDLMEHGEVGIIKIKNISSNTVDIINTQYISEILASKVDTKFKLCGTNLLIAMTGAEVGKIGLVPLNKKELYLNQRVGCIKELVPGGESYAYNYLLRPEAQEMIQAKAVGSAQPNISGGCKIKC